MCARLTIALQPFADVISMADVHDDHVLRFQAPAVALIHGLPDGKCDPELINPRPYMRAGQIARPKTLTSSFSSSRLLFPVGRTHQNLNPAKSTPPNFKIQNSREIGRQNRVARKIDP